MAIVSPLGWLQNIGAVNSAQIMRMADGGAVKGSGLLTSSLAGRGGVLQRAPGNNMKMSQVGGGNMTVNVEPGICYVPGSEAFAQMGYWVLNDAVLNVGPFTTAHASLNRIDTVYVKVNDTFYSGALNSAQVLIKDGTAGSGVAGSLSGINNVLKLGEVTVRAGATSIITTDILDNSRYLTAPGGVTPIRGGEETEPGTHGAEVSIFGGNIRYWDATSLAWRMAMMGKFGSTGAIASANITPIAEDLAYITSTRMFNRWTGSAWEEWVPSVPGARLRNAGGTSVGTGAFTPLAMDTEDRDTLNGHSLVTNTSRYTCQRAGRYRVWGGWATPNTSQTPPQSRGSAIMKNGALYPASAQVHTGVSTNAHVSIMSRVVTMDMVVGDYVELGVFQNLGSAVTSQTSTENQGLLEVEWIGI
jgi:hypothetical protein